MNHVHTVPDRNRVTLIIDLQFGSTGKGLIAGVLAKKLGVDAVATAWAANAGHTFIDGTTDRKYIHTMLANGIVSPLLRRIFIGPGSIINPISLLKELDDARDVIGNGRAVRILIHPHAAVIYDHHVEAENEKGASYTKIGSTKKGVAEAAIERMRRLSDANIAANCNALAPFVVSTEEYMAEMLKSQHLLVEGAQGFSLSMYHGLYPYTTSRDVTVHQVLADCGVPRAMTNAEQLRVVGTLRTFPIRVANRYDENGNQIGTSGPCYDDQREIAWSDIGLEAELTTVTKLPRRVFTFSKEQLRQACTMIAPDDLFVNFVNYLQNARDVERFFMDLHEAVATSAATSAGPAYIGLGANERDVYRVNGTQDAINKAIHLMNLGA